MRPDSVIVIDDATGHRIITAGELLPGKTYTITRDVFEQADRELASRKNMSRKQKRAIKREVRAMQYRHAALTGGGERERERRAT